MRRLFFSLVTLLGVGMATFLTTSAFFSDTEISADNQFIAGAVDLKVDSECHYFHFRGWKTVQGIPVPVPDYEDVGCDGFGTWTSIDLTQEKFFNFDDVKPGDLGEVTISLKVENNDSWACMAIENIDNAENDRIEPEVTDGDVTDDPQGGELAQHLHLATWLDQGITAGWQGKYNPQTQTGDKGEGDNVWQGKTREPILIKNEQLGTDGLVLAIADANTGNGPLAGDITHYYGLAWCAGEMQIGLPGQGNNIYCDGEAMGNVAQTDSLTADVRFYAEQSRNNPDFRCVNAPTPSPKPLPTIGFELD